MALTASSPNGAYLGGLTTDGHLYLWHKGTEVVWMYESPLSQYGHGDNTKPLDIQGSYMTYYHKD